MIFRWLIVGFSCIVLLFSAPAHASTYISAGDEIYFLLLRLETEGIITDALLSARPLSRKEIARIASEADKNADGRSRFIRSLVQEIRQRLRFEQAGPGGVRLLDTAYARYVFTSAEIQSRSYPGAAREVEQAFNHNNDGDLYHRGSNYRAGLTARLEDLGPLSLYINPEYRSANDAAQGVLRTGYAVIGFSWIDIVVGRDSQWWGPGRHGSLLLSDNAEPLTMIKFTGPSPQTLPWVLKHLGPFQYNVFASRLEKERSDYSEPYFWGMRFDFKPHRNIEIGLERTAILGGRGRPTNATTWLHSAIGSNEHGPSGNPGDQRAGYDVKLTLPFRLQPVQVYWEQAGEEDRQRNSRRPYKLANLYGLYLPRIFGFERIELRAEYAENEVNEQDDVWYTHGTYTAGYTHRGMIMGHHMGTESRDLFLELSYLLPDKGARFSLSYDQEKHALGELVSERVNELILRGLSRISKHVELSASFGYGRIQKPESTAGPVRTVTEASGTIRYLF